MEGGKPKGKRAARKWVERFRWGLKGAKGGQLAQQVSAWRWSRAQQVRGEARASVSPGTQGCRRGAKPGLRENRKGDTVVRGRTQAGRRAQRRQLEHRFYASQAAGAARALLVVLPRAQVPVAVEAAAARVASRTKRATFRAQARISAKREALALLAQPNQGECFTPRRA